VEGFGVDHMQEMKRTETEQDNLAARDTRYNSHGREVLLKRVASEGRGTVESPRKQKSKKDSGRPTPEDEREAKKPEFMPPPKPVRMNTEALGLTQLSQLPALPDADDTDIGGPPLRRTATFTKASASDVLAPLIADLKLPVVTDDCMRDPVSDSFYLGTWHAVARDNTALFRQVFRCQPDSDVRNWEDYKEYNLFMEKWKLSQGLGSHSKHEHEPKGTSGPPGHGVSETAAKVSNVLGGPAGKKVLEKAVPSEKGPHPAPGHSGLHDTETTLNDPGLETLDEKASLRQQETADTASTALKPATEADTISNAPGSPRISARTSPEVGRDRTITISDPSTISSTTSKPIAPTGTAGTTSTTAANGKASQRRRRGTTKSSSHHHAHGRFKHDEEGVMLGREESEAAMSLVQGHLVLWPYDWLEREERNAGWLFSVDQLAPLEIYT